MRRVLIQSSTVSSSYLGRLQGAARTMSRLSFGGSLAVDGVAEHRIAGPAGQRLVLRLVLPAEGAGFTLHAAGGRAVPGAAPRDAARRWEGRLPAEGEYLVRLRATRRACDYLLEAEIG